MSNKNHLFLIDGSGYIFRAYYALPALYRKRDGLPTGAVNGFCNMLYKLIEDTNTKIKPSHIAVIFDSARKTFRNEIYNEYKANRGDPPEDLIPQFKILFTTFIFCITQHLIRTAALVLHFKRVFNS